MKLSRRRTTAVAATTLLSLPFIASAAAAQDEAAVAQAVEAFRKAMLTNDRAQLDALCAPQLSYGHSNGKVQTKAEFIADATSGVSTWKSISLSDIRNSLAGSNAISRFLFTGELETEGKVTPIRIRVLMVWQKQTTGWQLLARQAVHV